MSYLDIVLWMLGRLWPLEDLADLTAPEAFPALLASDLDVVAVDSPSTTEVSGPAASPPGGMPLILSLDTVLVEPME